MRYLLFCILWFSTNSLGAQWEKIYENNPMEHLTDDLYFISADTGFMVGSGMHVAKTTDGGRTWDFQWFENYSQAFTYDALSVIEFANDSVGFAAGTRYIFKTIDQGNTWQEIYDAGEYYYNFFEMVVKDSFVYVAGDNFDVYSYDLFNEDLNEDSSGSDITKNSISFPSKKYGYAIAFNRINTDIYKYYYTTDSGRSWNSVKKEHIAGLGPEPPIDLFFLDDSSGYILWGTELIEVKNHGLDQNIYSTSDWINNNVGDYLVSRSYNSLNYLEFYKGTLYAISSKDLIHPVVYSNDTGKTWQPLPPINDLEGILEEIEIFNGSLYLTTYIPQVESAIYRYKLQPTGVDDPTIKTNLKLYPTSNEGSFSLRLSSKSPLSKNNMQIVTMDGRQIPFELKRIATDHYQLKLSEDVASGMYIVNVESNEIRGSAKFVVE